jgi:hypothetical protein
MRLVRDLDVNATFSFNLKRTSSQEVPFVSELPPRLESTVVDSVRPQIAARIERMTAKAEEGATNTNSESERKWNAEQQAATVKQGMQVLITVVLLA